MSEPQDETSEKPDNSNATMNEPDVDTEGSQAKALGSTNETSICTDKDPSEVKTKAAAEKDSSSTVAVNEESDDAPKSKKSAKSKKHKKSKSADTGTDSKQAKKPKSNKSKAKSTKSHKKQPKSNDSRHSKKSNKKPKSKKHKLKVKPKSGERKSKSHQSQSKSKNRSKSKNVGKSTSSKKSKKSQNIKLHKPKKVDLSGAKIGFVGAGKMCEAIVRGLLTFAKIDPKKIFIAGKSDRNLHTFSAHGISTSKRSYDIFGKNDCDIVFLCVHGYVIRSCFKAGGTRPFAFTTNFIPNQKHPLFVLSLIGGIPLKDIKLTLLDPENPEKYMLSMNRLMLNVSVRYGLGIGAIDIEPDSKHCNPVVRELLSNLTKLDYFPEHLMDSVCAIGGNGIAFSYYFIAALATGGFKMGLNKVMATKLATRSLQSAAQCLLESNKHPSELQDTVTSQGGPAIYGLHVLEQGDCSAGFQNAIEASFRRLRELIDIEPVTGIEAKPFM